MFPERRDPRVGGYQGNHPWSEFPSQTTFTGVPLVNSLSKEPVYQILEKIQSEPYFKYPNKISGDASRRNQSHYCHYHSEKGHTTEDCRTLRNHLN